MFKKSADIYFSPKYLKKLVNEEHSSVRLVKDFKSIITLLPFHLGFLKSAISQQLRAKVGKYDMELDGLVMGFSNVRVKASRGLLDTPDITLSYIADVYVFSPVVGQTVKGVVNKCSREYVGVLVHNAFNASLFTPPSKRVRRLRKWPQVGETVTFEVSALDYSGRLIYIMGYLPSGSNESMETVQAEIVKSEPESEEIDTCLHDPSAISALFSHQEVKKKNKKSRRSNVSAETVGWDSGIASGPDFIDKMPEIEEVQIKHEPLSLQFDRIDEKPKKRKKKHSLEEPRYEALTNTPETVQVKQKGGSPEKKKIKQVDTELASLNSVKSEEVPKLSKRKRKFEEVTIKEEIMSEVLRNITDKVKIKQEVVSPVAAEKKMTKIKQEVTESPSLVESEETAKVSKRKRKYEEITIKEEILSKVETTPSVSHKKRRKKLEMYSTEESPAKEKKTKKKINVESLAKQMLEERAHSFSLPNL